MQNFSHLSVEETNQLIQNPLYIGLLIAHADGEVSPKELEWMEKVTHFRIKTAHHTLREYYQQANTFIRKDLNLVNSELPENLADRLKFLSAKIAATKPLIDRLDESMQTRLLDSYHSFALSVAEINGGLLNFFAHNSEEEKWLELDMLKD
jgi:hypothetical protein